MVVLCYPAVTQLSGILLRSPQLERSVIEKDCQDWFPLILCVLRFLPSPLCWNLGFLYFRYLQKVCNISLLIF